MKPSRYFSIGLALGLVSFTLAGYFLYPFSDFVNYDVGLSLGDRGVFVLLWIVLAAVLYSLLLFFDKEKSTKMGYKVALFFFGNLLGTIITAITYFIILLNLAASHQGPILHLIP